MKDIIDELIAARIFKAALDGKEEVRASLNELREAIGTVEVAPQQEPVDGEELAKLAVRTQCVRDGAVTSYHPYSTSEGWWNCLRYWLRDYGFEIVRTTKP